jgi:ion channel
MKSSAPSSTSSSSPWQEGRSSTVPWRSGALWTPSTCSVTTLTTVGLGDLVPTTMLGKLFTILFIFVGVGLIAGFINSLAKETFARERRGGDEGQRGAPNS